MYLLQKYHLLQKKYFFSYGSVAFKNFNFATLIADCLRRLSRRLISRGFYACDCALFGLASGGGGCGLRL